MITATLVPVTTGRNFVAGQWREGNGSRFVSHNPAHWNEVIGEVPLSSPGEVGEAVEVARRAFPAWRRTSRIHRAELFDNLAQLVKHDVDPLAELMARECGKVVTECRAEV